MRARPRASPITAPCCAPTRAIARCFETQDQRVFARRIAAAGCATDPDSADTLIAVTATVERAVKS